MYFSSMLLLIPALLFGVWAQIKVKSAYSKYSKVGVRSGLTGAQVAQQILRDADIEMVTDPSMHPAGTVCGLECMPGKLTDHYDPRSHTLRLSEEVYLGSSVASLGIAAHEAGHAIQHAQLYLPLTMRNVVYPISNIGSTLAFPLFFIGLVFVRSPFLMNIGIMLYSFAVFFTVVTLPVEFNASKRALRALANGGYLADDEMYGAKKVLTAAALTYVAAAAMAILQLVRMILISRD